MNRFLLPSLFAALLLLGGGLYLANRPGSGPTPVPTPVKPVVPPAPAPITSPEPEPHPSPPSPAELARAAFAAAQSPPSEPASVPDPVPESVPEPADPAPVLDTAARDRLAQALAGCSLQFAPGALDLDERTRARLERAAGLLALHDGLLVSLVTTVDTSDRASVVLSTRRANQVLIDLLKRGVPATQLRQVPPRVHTGNKKEELDRLDFVLYAHTCRACDPSRRLRARP